MPDIFGGEETTSAVVRADDLVGEGKKFKTVDDLARGKAEADAYIERLKNEKAEADRKLAEATNAEAELARLREQLAKQERPESAPTRPSQPDQKSIDAIVEESITRAETRRTQVQNVTEANRALVDHFSGDAAKAAGEVARRATELGLTVDEVKGIAARSPSAFKRLILGDLPEKTVDVNLTKSTVSPSAVPVSGSGPKVGTNEYYKTMLKADPRRYMSPATQAEILKHTLAGTYVPD